VGVVAYERRIWRVGFWVNFAKSFSCFLLIAFGLNSTNLAGSSHHHHHHHLVAHSILPHTLNFLAPGAHMKYWRSSSSTTTRDTRRIASETLSCRPVFPPALSCSTKGYSLLRCHSPTCTSCTPERCRRRAEMDERSKCFLLLTRNAQFTLP
jgi:hypothetical protein